MAQTSAGLNNSYGLGNGVTPHYAITYDNSLSAADGKNRANAPIADCEADYTWMSNLFGNIGVPFSVPMPVQLEPGPYAGASWPNQPPITVTPGNGQPIDLVRYLVVSEVVEMMMKQKDNGWGYSFGDANEGSKGEALSRFLGSQVPERWRIRRRSNWTRRRAPRSAPRWRAINSPTPTGACSPTTANRGASSCAASARPPHG